MTHLESRARRHSGGQYNRSTKVNPSALSPTIDYQLSDLKTGHAFPDHDDYSPQALTADSDSFGGRKLDMSRV